MTRSHLLDASGLLALLFDEPGAESLLDLLDDCAIHAVNLAEAVRKLADAGASAEGAAAEIGALNLEVIAEFGAAQAYEIARLAQDLAGGLMVTLPSQADFDSEVTGPILRKYLKGRDNVPVEHRARMLRLIENMTLGRNAVGYLTESLHGAGSPQAQRIQILRGMEVERKKGLARDLAGIVDTIPEDAA